MPAKSLSRARLAARAARIGWLVGKHWARFWVGFFALCLRFSGKARRRDWFGQVVLDLFRELGATFIKVGQIMSTRPDLIPDYVSRKLAHLQDDVGPFPLPAVLRTIEGDLGRPVATLFPEFAPVPLASASVSQVHKARLPDGRLVAVKVRRPDVVELCIFDLAVMRIGARILNAVPSIATLAPLATVEEFGRAIFSQLDFRVEAANNRRFRENFRAEPMVVFPEVIESLSSERILTMSFIDGTKILSTRQTRSDPKRVARLGLQVLLKMIFEDGFVHADLHPGNIFITPDDKIALLDLGLVGELDEPHRRGFTRFFAAWAQRDGDTMARLMYEMSANAQSTPTGGPARPRRLRALPRRHHRVRGPLLGPAHGRGAGGQGALRHAGHPAAAPRAREPDVHDRQHRHRRHRGDRQAARPRAGPHVRGPAVLPGPSAASRDGDVGLSARRQRAA